MLEKVVDYVRGTKIMDGAWPEGTDVNKYGDKRDKQAVVGDPNFVHATTWTDPDGNTISAKDDSLYQALGYVQYATGVFLAVVIVSLVISAL